MSERWKKRTSLSHKPFFVSRRTGAFWHRPKTSRSSSVAISTWPWTCTRRRNASGCILRWAAAAAVRLRRITLSRNMTVTSSLIHSSVKKVNFYHSFGKDSYNFILKHYIRFKFAVIRACIFHMYVYMYHSLLIWSVCYTQPYLYLTDGCVVIISKWL